MTEAPQDYPDVPDGDLEPDEGVEGMGDHVRTGDPRVDTVLDSLAGLDESPVEEHAAVFERAHEELRAALDPGEPSSNGDDGVEGGDAAGRRSA